MIQSKKQNQLFVMFMGLDNSLEFENFDSKASSFRPKPLVFIRTTCGHFHQSFTSSFYANFLAPKNVQT